VLFPSESLVSYAKPNTLGKTGAAQGQSALVEVEQYEMY